MNTSNCDTTNGRLKYAKVETKCPHQNQHFLAVDKHIGAEITFDEPLVDYLMQIFLARINISYTLYSKIVKLTTTSWGNCLTTCCPSSNGSNQGGILHLCDFHSPAKLSQYLKLEGTYSQ